MSEGEFRKFSALVNRECGIQLPPVKKTMLTGRLGKRLRLTGIVDFSSYFDFVTSKEGRLQELPLMINAVTTNKTDFFREIRHFTVLTEIILPQVLKRNRMRDRREINIWSAACSTGEEPYTIAMVMDDYFQTNGLNATFSVLATDISSGVLEAATMGIYDRTDIDPIAIRFRKKYLLRSKDPLKDVFRIIPSLRARVRFQRMNLMQSTYPVRKLMDVIFCRNVLIYFDRITQEKVVNKLCRHLQPGGYLILGHSESVQGFQAPIKAVSTAVYQKI